MKKSFALHLFDTAVFNDKKTFIENYNYFKAQIINDNEFQNDILQINQILDSQAFNLNLEASLRGKFLANLNEEDEFSNLYPVLIDLLKEYVGENSLFLKKLDKSIKELENTFFDNEFICLVDKEDEVINEIELSEEEKKKYHIKDNSDDLGNSIKKDIRFKNHDLVALKDLISILQGEKVKDVALGFGFFLNYINKLPFNLVFKVKDQKLESIISISKFNMDYSPTEASVILSNLDLEDNCTYYILVDGMVVGSKDISLEYENINDNYVKIPAGECFLFKNKELTRLFFMPYSYEYIDPLHTHNSVMFGNEVLYHSCLKTELSDIEKKFVKDYLVREHKENLKEVKLLIFNYGNLYTEKFNLIGESLITYSFLTHLIAVNRNTNINCDFQKADEIVCTLRMLPHKLQIMHYLITEELKDKETYIDVISQLIDKEQKDFLGN